MGVSLEETHEFSEWLSHHESCEPLYEIPDGLDTPEPHSSTQNDLSSGGAVSRQTNENKSVNVTIGGSEGFEDCDTATKVQIDKCVSEFIEKYPQKAFTPIATGDQRKLRREYAKVGKEDWVEDLRMDDDEYRSMMYPKSRPSGVCDGHVKAPIWAEVLKHLLHKYAATQDTEIHLRKSLFDKQEEYSVSAQSRWQPEYQKKMKAQLEGTLREFTGGERPSGGYTEAIFDDPYLVLITLSGSSIPDGTRIGPVDLFDEMSSTFSNHTYHSLRNTLRALGFDSDEWVYDRRAEPHASERGDKTGTNACYPHEHVPIVVDGEVSADDLRPIVETHVEHCEFAGEGAHGEGAIEVKPADEIDDIGGYVADYASVAPVGLLDREPEFQAFAAAAAAANYRTVTRSEAAREAAKVDMCRQRHESDKSRQELDHGETVRYDDGEIVCVACGCTHGIEQHQTLADYRKPESADNTPEKPTIADGGQDVPTDESRRQKLKEQWQDANAAASIGEPPERTRIRRRIQMVKDAHPDKGAIELAGMYDAMNHIDVVRQVLEDNDDLTNFDEVVGFRRSDEPEWMNPEWQIDSVTIRGETHLAGGGNGMEYVETTNYAERFSDVIDGEHWYQCKCGARMHGHKMSAHVGYGHGLETLEQVRVAVEREEYNHRDCESMELNVVSLGSQKDECVSHDSAVSMDDSQSKEQSSMSDSQAMKIKQLGRIRGKIRANPQITTRELATHFSLDNQTIEKRLQSLNEDEKISGSQSEGWVCMPD